MGRRTWIKIFSDKWLRGSIRQESLEVRAVWIDVLTLAADSAYGDDGVISVAPKCGLTDEQISAILNVDIKIWLEVKRKLSKVDKKHTERINVNGNNEIKILNWKKYQSEYARQRPYRKRLQHKVTSKSATRSDQKKREERREKEPSSSKLKFTEKDMELVDELDTLILEVNPKHKFDGGYRKEKWANKFRLMREQDKRSVRDIRIVMKWAFNNSFWSTVIQSTENLRKHYDQLYVKTLKPKSKRPKSASERPL